MDTEERFVGDGEQTILEGQARGNTSERHEGHGETKLGRRCGEADRGKVC